MMLPPKYEDRIDEVVRLMHKFAAEHCMTDGQLDALLFAVAAMQYSGSNLSLLPPDVAMFAMQVANDRLGQTYLLAKRIGEMN